MKKNALWIALLILIGLWGYNTPGGLLGKADAVGYAFCHRIDERSFQIDARAMPLCARCSGMYLGALLGFAFQAVRANRRGGMPPLRIAAVFVLFVVVFGIDGVNSYLHLFPGFTGGLYEPNNTLRLLTGTGVGLGIAAVLFPAFNQTVWQNAVDLPALPNLRELGLLLGFALALDALILIENPLILYPLALLSVGGLLLILSMVYAIVWMMLFRVENSLTHARQLLTPLLGGLLLAMIQVSLLDAGRFLLTGTWEGFNLAMFNIR
ncbi:MAG: hypothetical protein OHK0052_11770 [Anaerolineales bacterium]